MLSRGLLVVFERRIARSEKFLEPLLDCCAHHDRAQGLTSRYLGTPRRVRESGRSSSTMSSQARVFECTMTPGHCTRRDAPFTWTWTSYVPAGSARNSNAPSWSVSAVKTRPVLRALACTCALTGARGTGSASWYSSDERAFEVPGTKSPTGLCLITFAPAVSVTRPHRTTGTADERLGSVALGVDGPPQLPATNARRTIEWRDTTCIVHRAFSSAHKPAMLARMVQKVGATRVASRVIALVALLLLAAACEAKQPSSTEPPAKGTDAIPG